MNVEEQKTNETLDKLKRVVGAPVVHTVYIDGNPQEILLRHVRMGDIPKVIEAAGALLPYVTQPGLKLDFERLMFAHSNDCLNLLAALLGKNREWVDQLDPDEGLDLIFRVVEMNIDFFVRRVLPRLSEGLQRVFADAKNVAERIRQITGSTAFSSSSATVTESPTSLDTPT